jgi:hypothetical protein
MFHVLNGYDDIRIIIISLLMASVFLFLLNHFWPSVHRRPHNDVIGWQLAIIGTIYAVVIGFMIFAVWGNFQAADMNVDNEASALLNLFQDADGLPAQQRDQIQSLCKHYAQVLVEKEWPLMNIGKPVSAGHPYLQQMWAVLMQTPATDAGEQIHLSHALDQLSALGQCRHIREMQNVSSLPQILWDVLIVCGVITVLAACFIGSEDTRLHFMLVLALTATVSLVLVSIADIDDPFQGTVHIRSQAFKEALETMNSHTPLPALPSATAPASR